MFNGDGAYISDGTACVTTLLDYMLLAMAGVSGKNVADASSGSGNVVQEESAPAIRARSDRDHLERVNTMLASRSDGAGLLQATHVERSSTNPGVITTHINILGNNTSLAVHTNGSYASAAFTKDPVADKRDYLPTNYDYFTFNGVDGVKITAQQLNGTFTDPYYNDDLLEHAQNFVQSANQNFNTSDAWTYQVCNNTASSPLFYGKIIAELTIPEQRLGYEDVTAFSCSTEGFEGGIAA
ncbi:hypothetical protein LTS10_012134 [Elasticomyces elasticus]|nr:hypothetical protein LTS10_012134 [Elasticomyces elasticus]